MSADGDGTVTLHGPPVTVEMQQVFGPYAGGAQVTGLVLLKDGVKVVYADGSDYLFVAVPDGSTLMARPDGKLEVKPGLRDALDQLEAAVGDYRMKHDLKGDGHTETGRAWDRMKAAQVTAREVLCRGPFG